MAAFFLSARPDNIFLVKRRAQRSLFPQMIVLIRNGGSPLLNPPAINQILSVITFILYIQMSSFFVRSFSLVSISIQSHYIHHPTIATYNVSIHSNMALGVISFSPFVTAWPRTCHASCVMTVTATVTETAPCSAILSASATSSVETSMAGSTSNSTYEHRTHHHHHTSASVPHGP